MLLQSAEERPLLSLNVSLVVVVPTRNRSDLLARALSSIMPQLPANSFVVVSDNSTTPAEVQNARWHVDSLDDARVLYWRAPVDMAMGAHWDWVFRQLLNEPLATHATVLTDRMIFKRGSFARLVKLIGKHPDKILTYNHDVVIDNSLPARLGSQRWTGRCVEVRSEQLLALSAKLNYPPALPRMLNCIVPMSHLRRILEEFGTICDSVSPDFCHAYRSLALVDDIRYLDEAPLVHGSLSRSNGASYGRGATSGDHADFIEKMAGKSISHAAPVPGFNVVANAVSSEYELVRRETGSPRFRPLHMEAYFAKIRTEIGGITDPAAAHEMYELLQKHHPNSPSLARRLHGLLRSLKRRRPGDFVVALLAPAICNNATKCAWLRWQAPPPRTRWFTFSSPEDAFEFAQILGRRASRHNPELMELLDERGATAPADRLPRPLCLQWVQSLGSLLRKDGGRST